MKLVKRIIVAVLILLTLILVVGYLFVQTLKPDYEGQKTLLVLESNVEVYFDTYGIPHIYAANEMDATRALGYVHAQDRLWQMELLRRVGAGRISEVFGAALLDTDKFLLSLGIDEASKKTVANLDLNDEVIQMAQAYLEGINEFVDQGPTPIEFYLTGIDKSHFTLEDVYNSMGYMAFSFAMAHKTDPLLTEIAKTLGPDYLVDLEIDSSPETEWIKNYKSDSISNKIPDLVSLLPKGFDNIPVPPFIGSNSWALGPQKTKSGKVILANDPHIGFSQPSVWYEAHISTPNYEKYGYYMAGIPMPILGHDRDIAIGITMFENDDIDFYEEEVHRQDATLYKTPNGWESFETVEKQIIVKDAPTEYFSYQKTKRGPIMKSFGTKLKIDRPVSMSWIYTKQDNKSLHGLYDLNHAKGIGEVEEALKKIHAPGLNFMYGDSEGNIAWWATAKLYQLADSANTKFIMDGATASLEPLRYLDFSENPGAINSPSGYVYSANNQPDSIAGRLYPGYYLPENRAKRIVALLDNKKTLDAKEVQTMLLDNTSPVNVAIVRNLLDELDLSDLNDDEKGIVEKLGQWQGDYPLESIEAGIYHRWIYRFLRFTFEDELGKNLFADFLATHFHKRIIAPMSKKDNSIWWDDISTEEVEESKQDVVQRAFKEAVLSLKEDFGDNSSQWTWNRLHTVEHPHPMGQVEALRSFFNVGPFEIDGSREVINNMYFDYTEEELYQVKTGPSTRRVIDFSDIENSQSIIPTGQSGNPFSEHYKDQAPLYHNNQFRKMMMNKKEIQNTSTKLNLVTAKE
ncbi:MAG: penicillin acylase family protein [Eudoraea sp.]